MKDKRLENMRRDYKEIRIPAELWGRVEAAMERAKTELAKEQIPEKLSQKRESPATDWEKETEAAGVFSKGTERREGMKAGKRESRKRSGFVVWATRIGGAAAAAMLAITVLANSSATVAYAMEDIPILGNIVKIVTFRHYESQDNSMQANIKVPEIQVENPEGQVLEETTEELNRRIAEYTDAIIAQYEADVEAADGEGHQSVDLDYHVITDNDKLFSIRFDQLLVMASGAQLVKIYHVDKTTGEMIDLDGLFQEGADYVTAISENIKIQMKERMEEDEMLAYWLDSDMPEWDFKEIRRDATFYVNEANHLVIVFDEYEVGPGYMGSQEFEIPTDVVKDMVKEGYLES